MGHGKIGNKPSMRQAVLIPTAAHLGSTQMQDEALILQSNEKEGQTSKGANSNRALLPLAQLAGDFFDNFRAEIVQDAINNAGNRGIGF